MNPTKKNLSFRDLLPVSVRLGCSLDTSTGRWADYLLLDISQQELRLSVPLAQCLVEKVCAKLEEVRQLRVIGEGVSL